MRVEFSPDANILTLFLSEKALDHAMEAGPLIVHVTEDGEPVEVEVLDGVQFVEQCVGRMVEVLLQHLEQASLDAKAAQSLAQGIQSTFASYQAITQAVLRLAQSRGIPVS